MKDAIWVFKSFGFRAGVLFVMGTLTMGAKRFLRLSKKPRKFEELSDAEARQLASALGINPYQGRNAMNNQYDDQNYNRTLH